MSWLRENVFPACAERLKVKYLFFVLASARLVAPFPPTDPCKQPLMFGTPPKLVGERPAPMVRLLVVSPATTEVGAAEVELPGIFTRVKTSMAGPLRGAAPELATTWVTVNVPPVE